MSTVDEHYTLTIPLEEGQTGVTINPGAPIEQEKPPMLRRTIPGMAKKLHRGMVAIAVVAKLYRKYHVSSGQVPTFTAIKPTDSPPRQRERLAKSRVQVGQLMCRRCQKLFTGKDRCQCKAVVMKGKA